LIGTAGRLVGHFYIHNGDDSGSFANAAEFFNSLLEENVLAANLHLAPEEIDDLG
jgi:hypothetical protein